MTASWATGFIVIAEEFAVEVRGRALVLFQSASAIGAIFPSLLMPIFAGTSFGWRGLYVVGVLPLLIVIFLSKNFHETERFQRTRENRATKPSFFSVFQPPYRKHMLTVAALWFLIYLAIVLVLLFLPETKYSEMQDFVDLALVER